ncbi:MAG: 50S ribosomal protein L20 [Chloroflexi bacterium]|nr:50S ribosomal protein L20 [Chloroflexota bacterium]
MARVKSSVASRRRRKKVLKAAAGRKGAKSRLYKAAHEAQLHALDYAYRGRRLRKRQMRRLWIMRINAAARQRGLTYGQLMSGLRKANVEVDRKMLAELAVNNAEAFGKLADVARAAAA